MKPQLVLDFTEMIPLPREHWPEICTAPPPYTPPPAGFAEFIVAALPLFTVAIYNGKNRDSREWHDRAWLTTVFYTLYRDPTVDLDPHYTVLDVAAYDQALGVSNQVLWDVQPPTSFLTINGAVVEFTGSWPDPAELSAGLKS